MTKETEQTTQAIASKDSLFALVRFVSSLLVMLALALADLYSVENVPTLVYLLIGSLNGVDAYKLYREINK
jgi:hypothetical protein